ncbi:MAG: zeta toxin family protein [Alphaproteobacteria bacterium]|nr:zeta toxin family protein [Alphaproteobacteria bacterium]
MKKHPHVYIIAGPNGAGKTTFATSYLPAYAKCKQFVNADMIAQGISPFAPEKAAIKAGRVVLEQLHTLAETRQDFGFESTLSGKTHLSVIKKLKAQGYIIHLFYLWIPSVSIALSRIKERVAQGGHFVPSKDVRRRYGKSRDNFLNHYRQLADFWYIFDNSVAPPVMIAKAEKQVETVFERDMYEKI